MGKGGDKGEEQKNRNPFLKARHKEPFQVTAVVTGEADTQ